MIADKLNTLQDLQDAREAVWQEYLADKITKAAWTRRTNKIQAQIRNLTSS